MIRHTTTFGRRFGGLGVALATVLTASACDETTEPMIEEPVEVAFAMANVGGVWPDQTTFLQGLTDLDEAVVGIENATELESSGTMLHYNGALYVYTFGAPATLIKYVFDEDGIPVEEQRIVTPGANTYSTIQFVDENTAYASVAGGLARVVKFDPAEMRVTGEIDLSSLARPEANSLWYIGSHVRDGKLFLAVDYQQNFASVYDSAFVAVIDMAGDSLETVISDGRTSMIFAAGATVQSFVEDDNGDIYVQARGNQDSGGTSVSGILRIPAGETDFDPDYFFDLDDALGGPAYGLVHVPEEEVTFTFLATDPDDRWEFSSINHRMHRIDLDARTDLGAVTGIPLTAGSSTQIVRRFDPGTLHMVVSNETEDAIYTYDVSSGTASKLFDMTGGMCVGLDRVTAAP